MSAEAYDVPTWNGDVLVVRCQKCKNHPGARYADGSGVCQGCRGSGYFVLARRTDALSEGGERDA